MFRSVLSVSPRVYGRVSLVTHLLEVQACAILSGSTIGTPDRIRTCNLGLRWLLIRSQLFYPIELQACIRKKSPDSSGE